VGVTEAMFSAVVMAIAALCAAAIALLICYWLGRLALDRRRLARWASEWSLTGPRWTARRR
jgi:membrane protein DedA with SNARE-associated domain